MSVKSKTAPPPTSFTSALTQGPNSVSFPKTTSISSTGGNNESTPSSFKYRKARSSSDCVRLSDPSSSATPGRRPKPVVILSPPPSKINEVANEDDNILDRTPATPRDQVEPTEIPEVAPESLGRWRRKSVNIGSPLPSSQTQAQSFYDFVQVIGEGKTSHVYLGVHKRTGEEVAIKVIDKRRIILNRELAAEVAVLKKLAHPNIIGLKDVFITLEHLQIVMELCHGHELFEEIVDRRTFSEQDARDLVKSILDPLSYLHSQGIAHRDLKPENIMFVKENDIKQIKIVDFGFAKTIDAENPDISMAGTLGYKAPEIFNRKPYTTQCDMWSLGVITYILLCGFPPFFSQEYYQEGDMLNNAPFWFFFNDETDTLLEQIKNGKVSFPDSHWKNISPAAKHFVQMLLQVEVDLRLTANQALQHPWITTWKPEKKLTSSRPSDLKTQANLQRLQQVSKLIKAGSSSSILLSSSNQNESTKSIIERHILANSDPTIARPISPAYSLIEVKARLINSSETQREQSAMLKALDPAELKEYVSKRKGSLDSRAKPPPRKIQRKNSF